MSRLLGDEDVPLAVVIGLRGYGHDVVTVFELGKANQEWPDGEVFKEAVAQARILVTKNRRDYYKLHRAFSFHYGIVACADDTEFDRAAANIHNQSLVRTCRDATFAFINNRKGAHRR